MSKLIFVNLPVSDLQRSTAFYEAVGAAKNPHIAAGLLLVDTNTGSAAFQFE